MTTVNLQLNIMSKICVNENISKSKSIVFIIINKEMGSDQSTSSAADQQQRDPDNLPLQGEVSSSNVQTDPRDSLDPDTDLPQCRMGTRKVDDMSFVIACTNWY